MEMNVKDNIEIIINELFVKQSYNKKSKWEYVSSYLVFKGIHETKIVKRCSDGYKIVSIDIDNREFCTIFTHSHRQKYDRSKKNFEYLYNNLDLLKVVNSDFSFYPPYAEKERYIEVETRRNNDILQVVEVTVYYNEKENKICFRGIEF